MRIFADVLILMAALTSLKATAHNHSHCPGLETGGYEFGSQSPVELISNESFICEQETALKLHNYNRSYQIPAVVTNNGHTVNIDLPQHCRASISGGPLKHEVYNALGFHFHWGEPDSCGSEHVLDNNCFSMELHIVHIGSNCSSLEEAISKGKVAVMGIFIQEDSSLTTEHEGLAQITEALKYIQAYNGSTEVSGLQLSKLISDDGCKSHLNYRGSLTTPPYAEVVNWILCAQVVRIPSSQYIKFLTMRNALGERITNNNRQIQPRGFRRVCRTCAHDNCEQANGSNKCQNYNGSNGNGNGNSNGNNGHNNNKNCVNNTTNWNNNNNNNGNTNNNDNNNCNNGNDKQ